MLDIFKKALEQEAKIVDIQCVDRIVSEFLETKSFKTQEPGE